jgi:methyl-accepting chemotaxis protein
VLTSVADRLVVTASQSADDAQSGLAATEAAAVRIVGAVMLGVVLLCAGLGLLIGRGISRPIRQLAAAMRRMAVGDLETPVVGTGSRDEIGTMAKAVLTFKTASAEKRRLEAAAARDRQATEAERAARENEKRAEAENNRFAVEALGHALGRLAAGDLLVRIQTPFEMRSEPLRQDFNAAAERLQLALRGVSTNAQSIRGRTSEIALAAENLSLRTEQQAASLSESAASLSSITQTVQATAKDAGGARAIVATANAEATATDKIVRQAIAAMGGIEASSQQIGTIIGVVDEIAFQTNLLALNAGVEAARAGESGRGFAVVAAEVRALAQRSTDAAKQIKTLVASSTVQVDRGVDLVAATGQALGRISVKIAELDTAVDAIAARAGDQAGGLQQINRAVSEMELITQQNAVMVEETTAAAQALAAETEGLARSIGHFRTVVEGRAERGRAGAPARRRDVAAAIGGLGSPRK